ncbi:MAG: DUF599 family protein [Phenylobacterium sp.]
MSTLDIAALVVFAICWLAYQPLLVAVSRRAGGAINTDMTVIRAAWMRNMVGRENRFMDGQLLGHALNSASFFASSNLILIAATASALFGGEDTFRSVSALVVVKTSTRMLFELQLALVVVALARGLLDFIWSIRQMNYCIAAVGATPEVLSDAEQDAFGDAVARILNPALSSFNAGVRGYYFALAAAAWLFGPWTFMAATLGAVALLFWRQRRSRAAYAIADLRRMLESRPRRPAEGGGSDPTQL